MLPAQAARRLGERRGGGLLGRGRGHRVSPVRRLVGPVGAVSPSLAGCDALGRTAGDELDDLVAGDVGGAHLRGHPAEVQHRDAVGDLEDVVEVVADEHDRQALVREPAHELEHLLGLRDAERRGRLVEDDDLGVPQHRPGDRHGLALTAGQARDLLADRLHRPHRQSREGLLRAPLHRRLVEASALGDLAAEEQVVDDVEVVAEREVLVDDLDAEGVGLLRVGDRHRAAVEDVVAGVEPVDAGDPLDEGALAGAVVTDERGDLPGVGVEVDALQDVHRAEALVHPPQRQQGGVPVGGGVRVDGARDGHADLAGQGDGAAGLSTDGRGADGPVLGHRAASESARRCRARCRLRRPGRRRRPRRAGSRRR